KLQQQRAALVNRRGPIFFQDNVRPHVAESALKKLNELGYAALPHPPYPSDLSSTDYHFFRHLLNILSEKCFASHDNAKNAFNEFIASRTPDFCATGVPKLVSR
ncbi:hypothetical protein Angca_009318, partial [Angiostrongylus cantonensis]